MLPKIGMEAVSTAPQCQLRRIAATGLNNGTQNFVLAHSLSRLLEEFTEQQFNGGIRWCVAPYPDLTYADRSARVDGADCGREFGDFIFRGAMLKQASVPTQSMHFQVDPVVAARQYFSKRAQCYRGTRRVTEVSRWIRGNIHELSPAPSPARNESGHCRGRGAQLGPNLPIELHHQDPQGPRAL